MCIRDSHRTRAVERDHGGDVFERRRCEPEQQRTQRPTLELEHTDRVGAPQELERLLVVEWTLLDVGPRASGARAAVQRALDAAEVAPAAKVPPQQAEL